MLTCSPATRETPIRTAETPRVSVVMPVRNGLRFLDEAIASILHQTFRAFEFIIVDDASSDGSWERLQSWASRDSRIRLARNPAPPGPVASSNYVVSLARAELVARMDSDDIAAPHRLERQLGALEEARDAVLVGSMWLGIDSKGRVVRPRDRSQMGSRRPRAPFCHGSIMFRRSAFNHAGGYRDECAFWEDNDLYLRMARLGRILILPESLYRYRFSSSSTRLTSEAAKVQRSVDLYFRCSDALAAGTSYEEVLAAGPRSAGEKVSPRAFAALVTLQIWEGRRPHLFRRAVRHSRPPRSLMEVASFLYIAAGTLHPRFLRSALQANARRRERKAAAKFPDGALFEWYWSSRQSLNRLRRRGCKFDEDCTQVSSSDARSFPTTGVERPTAKVR